MKIYIVQWHDGDGWRNRSFHSSFEAANNRSLALIEEEKKSPYWLNSDVENYQVVIETLED